MAIHDNLNGNSNQIYYLGSGTSFNIKALLPNVDYAKLTVNNFLRVTPSSISTVGSYQWTSFGGDYVASVAHTRGGMTASAMSYNASTGVLTAPAIQAYGQTKNNNTGDETGQLGACSATCKVYLVIGDVESV